MIPEVPFTAQKHKLLSHVHRIINPANSKLNDRLPNINRDNLINVPPNIWWSFKTQTINRYCTDERLRTYQEAGGRRCSTAARPWMHSQSRLGDWWGRLLLNRLYRQMAYAAPKTGGNPLWAPLPTAFRPRALPAQQSCRLHHILLPDKFSLGASFRRVLINYYTNQL